MHALGAQPHRERVRLTPHTPQEWQGAGAIPKSSLVFPLFIVDDDSARQPIAAMPGQFRWGASRLGVRGPARVTGRWGAAAATVVAAATAAAADLRSPTPQLQ